DFQEHPLDGGGVGFENLGVGRGEDGGLRFFLPPRRVDRDVLREALRRFLDDQGDAESSEVDELHLSLELVPPGGILDEVVEEGLRGAFEILRREEDDRALFPLGELGRYEDDLLRLRVLATFPALGSLERETG